MDSPRSILVHLDAGRHAAARLACARALAAQHDARLRALLALQPPLTGSLPLMPANTGDDRRREARAQFDRAVGGEGWPVEWLAPTGERPTAEFSRAALHADLLVLGQRDPRDAEAFDVPSDFVESVLIGSGTPALVLPFDPLVAPADFSGRFATVLIAWQPCREAARALNAALPWLQRADAVHLAGWSGDLDQAALEQQEVTDHLRLHAVDGVQCHRAAEGAGVGAALLALATGLGADLVVMGCYGHGRARELILGGASATALREARMPLLMAH